MHTIFQSLSHQYTKLFLTAAMVSAIILWPSTGQAVGIAPSVIDIRVQPGTVVTQTITVVNTDDENRSFAFTVDNFTPSVEPGVPIFDGGARDDFPKWVSFSHPLVDIKSGSHQLVDVDFKVPLGSRPGDYYGVIFVGSPNEHESVAKAAALVFLTIEGDSQDGIDLVSLDHERGSSYIDTRLTLRVQNSGNVYTKPEGTVTFDPLIGRLIERDINPDDLRILSGQTREWQIGGDDHIADGFIEAWQQEVGAFAIGPVRVHAEVVTEGGIMDGRTSRMWVFPWRSLILLMFFLLVVGGFRKGMAYVTR